MNSPGEIMPRSGWFQRTSASMPLIAAVRERDLRLEVDLEGSSAMATLMSCSSCLR